MGPDKPFRSGETMEQDLPSNPGDCNTVEHYVHDPLVPEGPVELMPKDFIESEVTTFNPVTAEKDTSSYLRVWDGGNFR